MRLLKMDLHLFIEANLTSVPVISFLLITLNIGAVYRKQCIALAHLDPHTLLRYHRCSNSLAIVTRSEKRKITTQL